jgi:CBS domain-containing protein
MTAVTELDDVAVSAAMHPGVITCPPETPLRDVARMMARHRVHAIVVDGEGDGASLWGVVTDADLIEAAARGEVDSRTAGGTARTPTVVVYRQDSVQHAAQLLREHGVTHLIVLSPVSERPIGVLSGFDVARALASEPT